MQDAPHLQTHRMQQRDRTNEPELNLLRREASGDVIATFCEVKYLCKKIRVVKKSRVWHHFSDFGHQNKTHQYRSGVRSNSDCCLYNLTIPVLDFNIHSVVDEIFEQNGGQKAR